MQCTNCGTQLAEGEITCPRCGTPVDGIGQPYTANKVEMPQQVSMNQQPIGQVPIQQPFGQQPIGQVPIQQPFGQQPVAEIPQEENKKSGGGRKILIIIIILGIIALLSIMIYSVVLNPNKKNSSNKTPSSKEKTPTKQENKVDYGGYTFTIPEGYQSKISNLYGLIIYNEKEAYSIAVDYTNSYETRKTTYMTHFPDQAATLVANVANREYLALVIAEPTGGFATQYATAKTEKANFIGIVVKSDYSTPGPEEFTNLTAILDNAKQKEEVSPGSANDAGITGIQIYTVDFNEFYTATQQQSQEVQTQ